MERDVRWDVGIEQRVYTWVEGGRYCTRVRQHPRVNGLWNPLDKTRKFRSEKRRDRWVGKMRKRFARARWERVF